jgi:vacuolar-type H+-ATPase subunit F/Vma7
MGRPKVHEGGLHHLHILYPDQYSEFIRLVKVYAKSSGRPIWEIIMDALKGYFERIQANVPTHIQLPQKADHGADDGNDDILDRVRVEIVRDNVMQNYCWFLEVCEDLNRKARLYPPRPGQPADRALLDSLSKVRNVRADLLRSLASINKKHLNDEIKRIAKEVVDLTPLTDEARKLFFDWINGKLKLY